MKKRSNSLDVPKKDAITTWFIKLIKVTVIEKKVIINDVLIRFIILVYYLKSIIKRDKIIKIKKISFEILWFFKFMTARIKNKKGSIIIRYLAPSKKLLNEIVKTVITKKKTKKFNFLGIDLMLNII